MSVRVLTAGQARAVNELMPGNQNVFLGDKVKYALDVIAPPGNVWFVSRNVFSSGDGKAWDTAFKTIGEAIAQVNEDYIAALPPTKGRNATIYIGEGWYSETPLLLTANDVTIIGVAPGSHDPVVLYGSGTLGGWDSGAGGPALSIVGSNCDFINMGFFTHDALYPAVREGGHVGDTGLNAGYVNVTGNRYLKCSFVRNVDNGSLGGLDIASSEGPDIFGCRFSTSQKDWAIRIRSNGHTNPVGVNIKDAMFVGMPIGVQIVAGSDNIVQHCIFMDDMTDRAGAISTPITNEGNNLIAIENYWEFDDANSITGNGDHLNINNFQLAKT